MSRTRCRTAVGTALLLTGVLAGLPAAGQNARPAEPSLSMDHAAERAARVSNVAYAVDLRLSAELPEYAGSVTIRFDLASSRRDLTLDFHGGVIYSVRVNGQETDGRYNDFYLTLPGRLLESGANAVEISFSRPYSDDGTGLYRFRDPEDGRNYLYTDFEPYDQNRLFPSFDQPNLKARFTTRVTAPEGWQVITNTRETSITAAGDERIWTFPATKPISTYVYALHAGDYHVWESAAGGIPLRLFARESLVPYIHPEHWFEPTRLGFEFYQTYFDVPYPFGKYDQIIVPHFNSGAMENVGAVTFNESYLGRGAVTRQDRRTIASVILHEMAHMWFGDLVTMNWWNGLWLNESFATVMAVISMAEATEFTDEWQESFRDTVRAYQADERDTTHPIELPIANTDGAFANFDRITYEKGSATLVQLMHLVGPETFRRGVSDYLKTHAYANTSIDDFLGAISQASGVELEAWSRDWLREPGTNSVEVELACAAGRIDSLVLRQDAPPAWPTLRTHRTQLALYYFGGDGVDLETLPATYSGELTSVPEASGLPCPDYVYPNHADWDYVRVRLAPQSLPGLRDRLLQIDDPLARLMLWQSVWDLVLDARMAPRDYLDFALANLAAEPDENAARAVLGAARTAQNFLVDMDSPRAAEYAERLERVLWDQVLASEPGSDRQILFYDSFVAAASSESAVDRLARLLTDPATAPAGVEVDQDRRWAILGALAASGQTAFPRLLAAERERDSSDEGRRRALAVEVAPPDAGLKTRTIDALLDPAATPNLAEFRAIARGLYRTGQHDLELASLERLLDYLPTLVVERDATFYSAYVGGLLGPVCSDEYVARVDAALAGAASLHPIIVRGLRDARFEAARCLRIAELESR